MIGKRDCRTCNNQTKQVDRNVDGSEHCDWRISNKPIVAKFRYGKYVKLYPKNFRHARFWLVCVPVQYPYTCRIWSLCSMIVYCMGCDQNFMNLYVYALWPHSPLTATANVHPAFRQYHSFAGVIFWIAFPPTPKQKCPRGRFIPVIISCIRTSLRTLHLDVIAQNVRRYCVIGEVRI